MLPGCGGRGGWSLINWKEEVFFWMGLGWNHSLITLYLPHLYSSRARARGREATSSLSLIYSFATCAWGERRGWEGGGYILYMQFPVTQALPNESLILARGTKKEGECISLTFFFFSNYTPFVLSLLAWINHWNYNHVKRIFFCVLKKINCQSR